MIIQNKSFLWDLKITNRLRLGDHGTTFFFAMYHHCDIRIIRTYGQHKKAHLGTVGLGGRSDGMLVRQSKQLQLKISIFK